MRRWIGASLALLVMGSAIARADLSKEQQNAAYCYGVAIGYDDWPLRNRLADELEAYGLAVHVSVVDQFGRAGFNDSQACRKAGNDCAAVKDCGIELMPKVIDGDTIHYREQTFRLWGIDAPEMDQTCADGWEAGKEAKRFLEALMVGKYIFCEDKGRDQYNRRVGLCRADDKDLQAQMVEAGRAWAFDRYSRDYDPQQERATAAHVGVHGHGCEPAWIWRVQRNAKSIEKR